MTVETLELQPSRTRHISSLEEVSARFGAPWAVEGMTPPSDWGKQPEDFPPPGPSDENKVQRLYRHYAAYAGSPYKKPHEYVKQHEDLGFPDHTGRALRAIEKRYERMMPRLIHFLHELPISGEGAEDTRDRLWENLRYLDGPLQTYTVFSVNKPGADTEVPRYRAKLARPVWAIRPKGKPVHTLLGLNLTFDKYGREDRGNDSFRLFPFAATEDGGYDPQGFSDDVTFETKPRLLGLMPVDTKFRLIRQPGEDGFQTWVLKKTDYPELSLAGFTFQEAEKDGRGFLPPHHWKRIAYSPP